MGTLVHGAQVHAARLACPQPFTAWFRYVSVIASISEYVGSSAAQMESASDMMTVMLMVHCRGGVFTVLPGKK